MLYLDDHLPDHPKILAAGALIGGTEGPLIALGLYVKAICYARRHATDGAFPASLCSPGSAPDPPSIRPESAPNPPPIRPESAPNPPRRRHRMTPLAALVRAHLVIRRAPATYVIHDYHDWNPTSAQVKEAKRLAREKKARQRAAAHDAAPTCPPPNRDSVPPPVPVLSREKPSGQIYPRPDMTSTSTSTSTSTTPSAPAARTAVPPSHAAHVFCGRVCVPKTLHAEFVTLRNHPTAEAELHAWYATVTAAWTTGAFAETRVGSDAFRFWKARFDETWAGPRGNGAAIEHPRSRTVGNAAAIRAFATKGSPS